MYSKSIRKDEEYKITKIFMNIVKLKVSKKKIFLEENIFFIY